MASFKSLVLVSVVALLAVIGVACGTGETQVPPTVETTLAKSVDGLDCVDDVRMMTIVEPAEDFEGHPSPEAAVAAIAKSVGIEGTPELRNATWYLRAADGRAVGMAEVGPWGEGWFAGEMTACDEMA